MQSLTSATSHMRLTSALDMLMQQCDTQVLVMGKISQAAIVAGAAYRNEDTFKLQTGITKTRLIKDKIHHDTKVHGLQDTACCAIMPTTQKRSRPRAVHLRLDETVE